jgi:hypothetical protein
MITKRPLLAFATLKGKAALERKLAKEESTERKKDQVYWLPLKKELEKLRHPK